MAHDFEQVKARFKALLVETRKDELQKLEADVDALLRGQVLDASDDGYGGWRDVSSAEDEGISSGGASFTKLVTLAKAWGSPQCKFAGDAEVAKRLHLAWQFYNRFVHSGCEFPNNWWAWQIGLPMHLGNTLLVAEGAFEDDVRESMVETLAYLVENIRTTMTGANAMWGGMNHLRYGLITGQTDHIALASEWAANECEIRPVNGILSDYSYSFHGMAVHMGYGRSHFSDVGRYVYVMGDSQWQLPEKALSNVSNWLLEFVRWTLVGQGIDPFIIGRECSRGEVALRGTLIIDGALLLSSAPIPRRDEVMAFCRRAVNEGLLPSIPVASEIANGLTVDASEPLYGTRYWPVIEYLSARRETFTASVKMSSTNTKSWFSIRNENLKAQHTSDGHLILRTREDAFLDGVLPTMDWNRLTGITRTDGIAMPRETEGQSSFVGGVAEGDLGCCGVDFKIEMEDGTGLFAKKSWFFIGDVIVALGSDILCSGAQEVETVIRQVVLRDNWQAQNITEDGLLVGSDCVYVFPDEMNVQVRVAQRTGRWHDLSLRQPEDGELLSRDYELITLSHGVKPNGADYAVVYLPNWTEADAKTWWQSKPFEIVQKDNQAHVIRETKSGKTLSVIWGDRAIISE